MLSVGNRHATFQGMCTSTLPPETQFRGIEISLAAARRGDPDAFASLVTPHTPNLQRLARRMTRSLEDAEDVCQESLLKAFTKIDQFDGSKIEIGEFRAWLMRITANCAIDFLRRKKASRSVALDDFERGAESLAHRGPGWGEDPESSYTREEQLRIVGEAIAQLPAELRIVCLFRNLRELSTKETAEQLGISTIAVRLRLFRAQGQLRKMLCRRMRRRSGRNRQWREKLQARNPASLN